MTSTPSSRPKPAPSGSPFLHRPRPARSPHRGRPPPASDVRLSLKRVVGTTCLSPLGFDAVQSAFAYIAGGAVVVVDVDVDRDECSQRFFRARPTALPVYNTQAFPYSPSTPTSTPKANDSRNRVSLREPSYDWSDSPTSKTWTSRERIKAATCLALSEDGRFLAVGETGYSPRVLIYSLEDHSSDTPLVSISEHAHGVKAVAWSSDGRYLASLGSANDGFLYIWKVDPKTGAAMLFQQNRCTSYVRGMVWVGSNLVTLGVRHIKVWRVDEAQSASPSKQKLMPDPSIAAQPQKTLPGRNVLLGDMIEATFSCAAAIDDTKAIICSENGDVCLFDDTDKQMKLTLILGSGLVTTCVAIHKGTAYLGGKSGGFLAVDLAPFLKGDANCLQTGAESSIPTGLLALGFLKENMIILDAKRSIHVMKLNHLPTKIDTESAIPIPGHRDAIQGVEGLSCPNTANADFYSWSASGEVVLWDVDGRIKSSFQVPLEDAYCDDELGLANQMTTIRATKGCAFFVTGDKHGIIRIVDFATKECVSTMKAHSSDCQFISIFEDKTNFLIASCGRDRTAQLFHKTAGGAFEHFQTLEFSARVAQVLITSADKFVTCSLDRTLQIHDLVTKEGEPDVRAAITCKSLPIKASPSSMAMSPDGKLVFVSLLDRSVCVFNVEKKKAINSFKCLDESGIESVVLDSLTIRQATDTDPALLLGISNTDKSIRIYDAQTGLFLDREWGHTESINGVTMIEEDDSSRTLVSVGSDGTIMIWEMDLQDRLGGSANRDQTPTREGPAAARPTLRRVLSKTELVEFQRSLPSGGKRSPSRTVAKKRSLFNLSTTVSTKTPNPSIHHQSSPVSAVAEMTPSRRPSTTGSQSGSPPDSPKTKGVAKRPSLQGLNSARTKSNSNLKALGTLGSLNTATEQTCRNLRAYRKKLASSESINPDVLAELDQELRLTAVALGDRAARSKLMADTMNSLLDQYSERLVSLLDEKLRMGYRFTIDQDSDYPGRRPGSSGTGSSSGTG
ncbi:WD domain-containing protein [Biscogniauxia mediterranea]|nr:WD domain-containing protein [Biscogniauxia mediterranea]